MKKFNLSDEPGNRLVLENAPLAAFLVDRQGHYLYVNPAFKRTFGYTLKDIPTRRRWFQRAYPDPKYRRQVLAAQSQFLETDGAGIQYPITFKVRCREGSDKWVHFFKPVLLDGDRVLVFCHDFTAQHQAEEALRVNRERYRQIVETANEGIWVQDWKGRTIFVNPVLCEMLGFQSEDMLGRPVSSFLFRSDRLAHREQMDARRLGERGHYERRFRRKDGQTCWCLVSATPLRDSQGGYAGAFAMMTDITRRKETEEALSKSEEKFRLLSSHLIQAQESERKRIAVELHDEIGQSLIGLNFQMTNFRRRSKAVLGPLGEEIDRAIKTIDEMTGSVRRLSRDLRPAVLEHLGLQEALQWLLEDFSKKSGVTLKYDTSPPHFFFPREREITIFRIFQEALANIGKHSRATRIAIAMVKDGSGVVFSIRDNGVGFSTAAVRRTSPEERGLGLTAMQERAQLAGGLLEVWSRKGKGTRITFSIPLA